MTYFSSVYLANGDINRYAMTYLSSAIHKDNVSMNFEAN